MARRTTRFIPDRRYLSGDDHEFAYRCRFNKAGKSLTTKGVIS
jgi:hypothetical protein